MSDTTDGPLSPERLTDVQKWIKALLEERRAFWGNKILQDQQAEIERLRADALTKAEATAMLYEMLDDGIEVPERHAGEWQSVVAKLQRIAHPTEGQ